EGPGRPSINGNTINALSPKERERQHGDGHYAERRQLLHIVLDLLAHPSSTRRPPDLGAVFAALATARNAARRDALTRARRRWTQDHARERDRLLAGLRRAWDDYRAWRASWAPDLRAERWQAPKRRPPSPWVEVARKAIVAADVPKRVPGFRQRLAIERCPLTPRNIQEAILMAVGLVPVQADRSPGD